MIVRLLFAAPVLIAMIAFWWAVRNGLLGAALGWLVVACLLIVLVVYLWSVTNES